MTDLIVEVEWSVKVWRLGPRDDDAGPDSIPIRQKELAVEATARCSGDPDQAKRQLALSLSTLADSVAALEGGDDDSP